jgi:hypothetical protein
MVCSDGTAHENHHWSQLLEASSDLLKNEPAQHRDGGVWHRFLPRAIRSCRIGMSGAVLGAAEQVSTDTECPPIETN